MKRKLEERNPLVVLKQAFAQATALHRVSVLREWEEGQPLRRLEITINQGGAFSAPEVSYTMIAHREDAEKSRQATGQLVGELVESEYVLCTILGAITR